MKINPSEKNIVAKFLNRYKCFFSKKEKKSFYCSKLKDSLLHQNWTKFSFVKKEKKISSADLEEILFKKN